MFSKIDKDKILEIKEIIGLLMEKKDEFLEQVDTAKSCIDDIKLKKRVLRNKVNRLKADCSGETNQIKIRVREKLNK